MMMKFEKVGSLLKGYTVEGKYVGGFDFRTNSWVVVLKGGGTRNTMPRGFNSNIDAIERNALSRCASVLVDVWDDNQRYPWRYADINQTFAWIEKLMSVGLYPDSSWELMKAQENYGDVQLKKDFVQYCKDKFNGRFHKGVWQEWAKKSVYKNLIDKYGYEIFDYCYSIVCYIRDLKNSEYLEKLCRIVQRENVKSLIPNTSIIIDGLHDYVELHPEEKIPARNFLLELSTARKVYKENQNDIMNRKLKKHNDKPCLYYETDEWFARPLTNCAMFHDEAEQQHNCVERMYMQRAAEGETNIVQIRRKDSPNESWITVEVYRSSIQQFLLRFNQRVRVGTEEWNIENEYLNHIRESWED